MNNSIDNKFIRNFLLVSGGLLLAGGLGWYLVNNPPLPQIKKVIKEKQNNKKTEVDNGCCGDGKGDQCCQSDNQVTSCCGTKKLNVKVIYSGVTNTAKHFADLTQKSLLDFNTQYLNVENYEPENLLTEKDILVFIVASYNVANPLDWLLKWLEEAKDDFRIGKNALNHLNYAIFGLGDSAYGEEFNLAGKGLNKLLKANGAKNIYYLGFGDKNGDPEQTFKEWNLKLPAALKVQARVEADQPDEDEYLYESDSDEVDESELNDLIAGSDGEMVDLEDMGNMAQKLQKSRQEREEDMEAMVSSKARPKRYVGEGEVKVRKPRDMVNPMLHKSLTKQGYKVVGTHSGVKLCRWTKSALRGRGFCYKYAFYGIRSHLCMETTPSLACANKCVFCWRHHTNPVGTEWRWNIDSPEFILEGAMTNHYQMIKQMRGVPGVLPERFEEAFRIRHCALSLVGEPIMYPHINEFVKLLHSHRISSFLVTNAQFPDKIRDMEPVTQLYVSVDASTKESLKKVDRPLFKDFWERFLGSLDAIGKKGQRTVYRLTLVKEFNTDEIQNYAELINRGKPDFIEIKGVTYCGYSPASELTMSNVPYHQEVVHFVKLIREALGNDDYEISCEHAHSCSVLLTHKKFKKEDGWYTWIDYEKFHDLVASGKPFTSMDYCARTPDFAVFGSDEAGFAPTDTRHYRKKKN